MRGEKKSSTVREPTETPHCDLLGKGGKSRRRLAALSGGEQCGERIERPGTKNGVR